MKRARTASPTGAASSVPTRYTFCGPWAPWEQPLVLAGASIVLVGCADIMAQEGPVANLTKQQGQGWDVGDESVPLLFPGARDEDASGGNGWRSSLWQLSQTMTPRSPRWAPYYAPTLFQVLQSQRSGGLRAFLRPIMTPSMALAYRRGAALASLFAGADGCRTDVAIVVDAVGPESVATAAALASCFEPVFFFDNWPHPLGVVPSHLTLAAVLYYSPIFARTRDNRPPDRAPVLVLDRTRLAPYGDATARFDNRYMARVPPAGTLRAAGIHRLLYVTGSSRIALESDDLNDDLVALVDGGVDVRMVALDAFLPEGSNNGAGESSSLLALREPTALDLQDSSLGEPELFFGGSRANHASFFAWYGWERWYEGGQRASASEPPPALPAALVPAWAYRPVPRETELRDVGESNVGDSDDGPRSGGFGFHFGGSGRSGTWGRLGGSHGFG